MAGRAKKLEEAKRLVTGKSGADQVNGDIDRFNEALAKNKRGSDAADFTGIFPITPIVSVDIPKTDVGPYNPPVVQAPQRSQTDPTLAADWEAYNADYKSYSIASDAYNDVFDDYQKNWRCPNGETLINVPMWGGGPGSANAAK